MAKVFLDTNYFIGLVNRTPETSVDVLSGHKSYVSTLSCHILCYVNKIKVPNRKLSSFIDDFIITDLTENILNMSLSGPTSDLEDNIQLHSAVESGCDYFLTSDKNLLKLSFFGKTKITNSLDTR